MVYEEYEKIIEKIIKNLKMLKMIQKSRRSKLEMFELIRADMFTEYVMDSILSFLDDLTIQIGIDFSEFRLTTEESNKLIKEINKKDKYL